MSVPLNEQRRSELPLIAFTTCEPAALGVALFGFTASLADGPSGAPVLSGLLSGDSVLGASGALAAGALPALIAWTLCSIGMLASIGHLAKPLRAPRSLANLRSSWLSREILLVGAFWVALTAWVAASLAGSGTAALLFEAMGCVLGAILMYVVARAYQVSTRPAWCGPEAPGRQFFSQARGRVPLQWRARLPQRCSLLPHSAGWHSTLPRIACDASDSERSLCRLTSEFR